MPQSLYVRNEWSERLDIILKTKPERQDESPARRMFLYGQYTQLVESNRMTALKTLTLRLRGAKTELEDAGLETDNMVESTSTLQKKLLALTGGKVDIMLDANTFKSSTEILREMSAAWENMTDIQRAE